MDLRDRVDPSDSHRSALPPSTGGADGQAPPVFSLFTNAPRVAAGRSRAAPPGRRGRESVAEGRPGEAAHGRIAGMELTWYGRTCVRLKGRDAVVVADPYQAVVGPTGRGITGDIVTFSHPDDMPLPKAKGRTTRDGATHLPSSLDDAFVLDGPGEYEVKHVLVNGRPHVPRRPARCRAGPQRCLRRRGRRSARRASRRHRPHADRGEDRRDRPGRRRLRSDRRPALPDARRPSSWPSSIRRSWCRCRSARRTRPARRSWPGSSTRWGRRPASRSRGCSITPSGLPEETTTVLLESRGKV